MVSGTGCEEIVPLLIDDARHITPEHEGADEDTLEGFLPLVIMSNDGRI